jgi:hypothetical protein
MSTRTISFNDGFSSATAPTGVDGISNWVTAQAYLVSDVVIQGSKIYECLIAHTAGTFATDLAAVKWTEISQGAVDHTALSNIGTNTHAQIDTHLANTSNPHSVTKTQLSLGNVDNTSDATKNAAAVTLTNKTITGADFRTPTRLDMKQDTLANLTTYASTAADGQLCFATDTKATYVVKNSSLSSVGGAGAGINYILAPDADSGSTGWATYKNASGASIPDGTITGTANSTFAVSASTALRGTSNFLFTKNSGASRIGEGFYYPFTIDASDKGKVLQCSFEYQIASGTFVDDAMEFFIWDVTNSRLIAPAPSKLKNSGIIERFAFEFQSSIDSTSYRLFAHIGVATNSSNTIRFDNFILGPQAKLYGSAVTDWVSYAPSVSTVGVLSSAAYWRRVGDSIQIEGRIDFNGAGSASTLTVSLPSGITSDSAKLTSLSSSSIGGGYWSDSGVGFFTLLARSNTSTTFSFYQQAGTASFNTTVCASGDVITYNVKIPVASWSSSQVFSQDADTRVVAALIGGGAASYSANSPIIYSTVGLDTHGAYSTVSGQYTVKVTGFYNVNASGDGTSAAGSFFYVSVNGNTTAGYNRPVIAIQEVVNQGFSGSGKVYALAGQTIDVRSTNLGGSISSFGTLQIERISGPAQVAASESVSALYTGAPPTGTISGSFSVTTYGTKVKDSHNAYSGGTYTIPVSGTYTITAQSGATGTFSAGKESSVAIYIDGVQKYRGYIELSSAVSLTAPNVSVTSIPLLAGQAVTIQSMTTATTPAYVTTASFNYFSITRTGNY